MGRMGKKVTVYSVQLWFVMYVTFMLVGGGNNLHLCFLSNMWDFKLVVTFDSITFVNNYENAFLNLDN